MNCPCGSGSKQNECCGPLMQGEAQAETAEALMRSRYSAFAVGNVEYIVATHHPESRDEVDPDE
ncbi:MAG: YchJ family metal-binding protein, partial [Myxococcales bacterium]|nr:YchJ family metal-binding protein [Myxococcales bacterium]